MFEKLPKSLHRLENNQNDWDGLRPEEMNTWQRIAKKTRGLLTAANTITLMSTVVVMNGLFDYVNGRKAEGIAKVAAGRFGDIADGYVADRTSTKGRVGRALDPSVDFIQLGFALPMLVDTGALPIVPAVLVAAPKVVDAAATVSATLRRKEINPTKEGKWSITAIWTGIGAFILNHAIEKHAPGFVDTTLETIGWVGTGGGAAYHLPATMEYVGIGFGSTQPHRYEEQTANIQQ